MNPVGLSRFIISLGSIVASLGAQAYPGESIALNPVTGNYIITYWNPEMDPPGLETTTFVPATKIVPAISSRFTTNRTGNIVYRYSVTNGVQSKQVLVHIILDPVESVYGARDVSTMRIATTAEYAARILAVKANKAALSTPVGWSGSVAFGAGDRTDSGVRVGWRASVEQSTGLKPGSTMGEFEFSSAALPGIIAAEMSGDSPVMMWSGEGPPEDSAITQQLSEIEAHDYVTRNAAVPTIAVPVPFDAAVLLDRIRNHVATWPGKQLLDPTYATQLDRYLAAAVDAYRLNNSKAGEEQIETIRKMLAKEHYGIDRDDAAEHKIATRLTIDRLAARVLDFDLRYVLKRMEHGHEENDKRKDR